MSDIPDTGSGEVVLCQSPDGEVRLDVRLEHDSMWLCERQMAGLFEKPSDNVGLPLKNVYPACELDESTTAERSSVVRLEGDRRVRRLIKQYDLDAVISVGYRVNSARGTQLRIWVSASPTTPWSQWLCSSPRVSLNTATSWCGSR